MGKTKQKGNVVMRKITELKEKQEIALGILLYLDEVCRKHRNKSIHPNAWAQVSSFFNTGTTFDSKLDAIIFISFLALKIHYFPQ